MRINHVLVDFENVRVLDLRELRRDDVRVTVFLGSGQKKIPSELAVQMQALGSRADYVQICGNGPNALDFHIAFTIGEKCVGEGPLFFHIISNDTGFDPLIAYLKGKKILAARYKSIGEIPIIRAAQPKTAAARAAYFMEKLNNPTASKPRNPRTLANGIQTVFHRQLSDSEVDDIISILETRGYLDITDGKVTYP